MTTALLPRIERALRGCAAIHFVFPHAPVQWHTYPMAHNRHHQEVADVSRFLQQVLPAVQ